MNITPTECRTPGCAQPIFFVVTAATGSRMPLNVDPDPAGNIRLATTLDGTLVAVVIEQDELFTPQPDVRYMPHWATCTNPEAWRSWRAPAPPRTIDVHPNQQATRCRHEPRLHSGPCTAQPNRTP